MVPTERGHLKVGPGVSAEARGSHLLVLPAVAACPSSTDAFVRVSSGASGCSSLTSRSAYTPPYLCMYM